MPKEPGYCHHKRSGQAYVNLNGKIFYLGEFGSKESRQAYERLKAEFLANRRAAKFSTHGMTVMAELCLAYLDHAESYYRIGKEVANLKLALRPVSELYADLATDKFGPLEYETIRNWWLRKPSGKKPKREGDLPPTSSRVYVNSQMKRLMRVVKWGVAKGMIPASVHQTLKCIDPLKRGRVNAPECEPIRPVDLATVEATIKHLTPVVADMVRAQLLLGCRPGELVRFTPRMIDRSKEVWEIKLEEHKTAYRGRQRIIFVGPKAQAILKNYLLRGENDPIFSPQESMRQYRELQHSRRKTSMSCGNKPGSNVKANPKKKPRLAFDSQSYSKAISNAAQAAKVEHWSANQLRHTRATEIRSRFGLEAAASILGHSEIGVTQIYAEADLRRAIEVSRLTG